ncbi:uncharacterized protein LOC127723196 [Mytilus californianus]|uniref:uncharacterized protein LOC127723196 n=1 Tax=Mytilus californianus TaxID=6549 RepID=UPI002247CB47|nr:uncharacterized protein LOC127723196 [Mytilus californianus]
MRLSIYQGLLLLYKILQISAEQFTSETFRINPDKRDVKLRGFTYRKFENISPRACFQKCIRRTRCYSYNYNRASLRCEINMKPREFSGGNFQTEIGYNFVEIQHYRGDPLFDPCIGSLCKGDEVCEILQNQDTICVSDDCKIPNGEPINVALGKVTGQSSTQMDAVVEYPSEYAVDGFTNTFSHTNAEQSPYWWVDLGTIYTIMRIEIINRANYGERLHDLDIAVGPSLDDISIFSHYEGPGKDGEHLVFQRKRYTDGRFIKLTITNGTEMLTVAELYVFAYPIC